MRGEFSNPESVKKAATRVFAAIYLVIAIWTFGHSWRNVSSRYKENNGQALTVSPFCAALWPLYWSVVIQENK